MHYFSNLFDKVLNKYFIKSIWEIVHLVGFHYTNPVCVRVYVSKTAF